MQPQLTPSASLWQRAPLWRYCCYAGAGLTILAAGLPYLKPQEAADKAQVAMAPTVGKSDVGTSALPKKETQSLMPATSSNVSSADVSAATPKKKEHAEVASQLGESAIQKLIVRPKSVSNPANNLSVEIAQNKTPLSAPPPKIGASEFSNAWAELDSATQRKDREQCMSTQSRTPFYFPDIFGATITPVTNEGMACLYRRDGQLLTIRLGAPFSGTVAGIKIGDTPAQLRAKFGAPIKIIQLKQDKAYVYYKNEKLSYRFDVTPAGEIAWMLIVPDPPPARPLTGETFILDRPAKSTAGVDELSVPQRNESVTAAAIGHEQPAQLSVAGNARMPAPVPQMGMNDTSNLWTDLDASSQQREKSACLTSADRVPTNSKINPGETQVFLPNEGVRCFFKSNSDLVSIRMDAPFSGMVAGIRIGDTLAKAEETLGTPFRDFAFGQRQAYVFDRNTGTIDRFDVSSDGVVRAMFVVAKHIR